VIATEFILLLLALVLIVFEVILPGGILGIIAAACVLVALGVVYVEDGLWMTVALFFGSAFIFGLVVYLEFKLLAKTTLGKTFFLKEAVSGHTGSGAMQDSLIGKTGKTLTRLNPSGKVGIDGETYEASSQDGYMDAGQRIMVVSKDNFKLTIKKL